MSFVVAVLSPFIFLYFWLIKNQQFSVVHLLFWWFHQHWIWGTFYCRNVFIKWVLQLTVCPCFWFLKCLSSELRVQLYNVGSYKYCISTQCLNQLTLSSSLNSEQEEETLSGLFTFISTPLKTVIVLSAQSHVFLFAVFPVVNIKAVSPKSILLLLDRSVNKQAVSANQLQTANKPADRDSLSINIWKSTARKTVSAAGKWEKHHSRMQQNQEKIFSFTVKN